MAEVQQFRIGAEAVCADGPCGAVIKVVVDPVAREVTHLVVEPAHRSGLGRLVPLAIVDPSPDGVRLRATLAEFEQLPHAEETAFLPGSNGGYGGYGLGQVVAWPYFAHSSFGAAGLSGRDAFDTVVRDTLPLGEVSVHRNEPVDASDGEIGLVKGLVVDRTTRHVTHVLLQEGHLWGKKEVAIPISAVTRLDERIAVRMTRDEIGDLPPVGVEPPA